MFPYLFEGKLVEVMKSAEIDVWVQGADTTILISLFPPVQAFFHFVENSEKKVNSLHSSCEPGLNWCTEAIKAYLTKQIFPQAIKISTTFLECTSVTY